MEWSSPWTFSNQVINVKEKFYDIDTLPDCLALKPATVTTVIDMLTYYSFLRWYPRVDWNSWPESSATLIYLKALVDAPFSYSCSPCKVCLPTVPSYAPCESEKTCQKNCNVVSYCQVRILCVVMIFFFLTIWHLWPVAWMRNFHFNLFLPPPPPPH